MATAKVEPLDMKLEVVVLGVSDVDRAKAFYEKLGWRLDADFATGDDWRVVQLTPHNSDASIIFGKGIASAKPGLANSLALAVDGPRRRPRRLDRPRRQRERGLSLRRRCLTSRGERTRGRARPARSLLPLVCLV